MRLSKLLSIASIMVLLSLTIVVFAVDTNPPGISFAGPSDSNGSVVNRQYTFINVSISDAESNIDSCILEWNGVNESMTKEGNGTSVLCFINKTAADGLHTYKVFATDNSTNTASSSKTITFDTTAPVVVSTSPLEGGFIKGSSSDSFSVEYTESNVNTIILNTKISNGSFVKTSTTGCSSGSGVSCNINVNLSLAADGSIVDFFFNITDKAGYSTITQNANVTVDKYAPNISFSFPTPDDASVITTKNDISINITASDTRGVDSCIIEWNGVNESMTKSGGNCYISKTNIIDGAYTYKVHVNDTGGNTATSSRTVTLNTTRAVASFIDSMKASVVSDGITLTVINSDRATVNTANLLLNKNYAFQFNLSNISIELDNFTVSDLNSSALISITRNLNDTSILAAIDQSGGSLNTYFWVEVNGLLQTGKYIPKVFFSNPFKLYYYLNGSKETFNISRITNICDSSYSNLPCYNKNSRYVYLESFSGVAAASDSQAPALSVSSPNSDSKTSSPVSITYSVSDNSEIDKCWYTLNGGSNVNLANCESSSFSPTEGSNTIIIFVNDSSGNTDQETITFSYSVPSQSSEPSSSGSSDSSSTSSEPVLERSASFYNVIMPGTPVKVVNTLTNTGIKDVYISVNNKVVSARIVFQKLYSNPTDTAPEGKIHNYLHVNNNIDPTKFYSVLVTYSVGKSWIKDNSLDPSKVYLQRYETDKWVKYEGKKTEETDSSITYQTTVPGLSYFVVSGDQKVIECESGKRCSEKELQECQDGLWTTIQTCDICNSESLVCEDMSTLEKVQGLAEDTLQPLEDVTQPIGDAFVTTGYATQEQSSLIAGAIALALIIFAGIGGYLFVWKKRKSIYSFKRKSR